MISTNINSLNFKSQEDFNLSVKPKHMDVKWKDYKVSILTLALKIYRSGWEPDYVVCIGRGGMILGDSLSRLFQKKLGVIMCSSYEGEGEMEQGNLKIAEHISFATKKLSGNVLLGDDLVDSGKTLLVLKDIIKTRHPDVVEVKTAVIYEKTSTKYKPDFHSEKVDPQVWIFLPNEVFDRISLKHLPKKILNQISEESIGRLAKEMLLNLPDNPTESLGKEKMIDLAINRIEGSNK